MQKAPVYALVLALTIYALHRVQNTITAQTVEDAALSFVLLTLFNGLWRNRTIA